MARGLADGVIKESLMNPSTRLSSPNALDSSRPLIPDLPAAGRRRSITCIHAGESTQDENAISILLENQ